MEKRIKLRLSGSVTNSDQPNYVDFCSSLGVDVPEEDLELLRRIKFRRSVFMTISMEECRALKDVLESFLWKDQDDLCQIFFENGDVIDVDLEGTGVNGECESVDWNE